MGACTVLVAVLGVVGCDDSSDGDLGALDQDGAVPLSVLLRNADPSGDASLAGVSDASDVDQWTATVDRELAYAQEVEPFWTDQVRVAVYAATEARERARGNVGVAREAAIAEARSTLDAVPWGGWTETLVACVDARISAEDLAQARDERSGRDPGWQARVRRAMRLREGAREALEERDARRGLQRAFYACELASEIAGEQLGSP